MKTNKKDETKSFTNLNKTKNYLKYFQYNKKLL